MVWKHQLQHPEVLQECYRSVLWLQERQLQHLGVLRERSVAPGAPVAASRSATGVFCCSGSASCSIWECYRSVLLLREHLLSRSAAYQLLRPGQHPDPHSSTKRALHNKRPSE